MTTSDHIIAGSHPHPSHALGLPFRRALATRTTLALLMFTGSASATLSLDRTTDTTVTIDADTHHFGHIHQVTSGNYQYWGSWDAPDANGKVHLQLSRRRLSDNNVVTLRFNVSGHHLQSLDNWKDIHNYVGVGLSAGDGRVHLSFANHSNDRVHNYLISAAGCMNLTQAQFNFQNCSFTETTHQVDQAHEAKMTYPMYFNDNQGRLYFSWRYDGSARGDQYLNFYDHTSGTWSTMGRIMQGTNEPGGTPDTQVSGNYTFDPDGPGPLTSITTNPRGVYVDQWEFDRNDRLHVMWRWREFEQEAGVFNAQHGVHYAYSDDYGASWFSTNGTHFANADTDTIRVTDASLTHIPGMNVLPGYWIGTTGFELDSHNQPHLIVPTAEVQTQDGYGASIRQQHFWRTTNGTWYSQFIGPAGTNYIRATVGDLMFDEADVAYFLFGRSDFGWYPYNSNYFQQDQLPYRNVTWQNGGYMDVRIHSATTYLLTDERVGISISTAGNNQVRVRMKNASASTNMTISWTTDTDQAFSSNKSQTFGGVTANSGSYLDYTFTITAPTWTGTLRELELGPAVGVSSGNISFDSVKITNAAGTVAKSYDFDAGFKVMASEATPTGNWSTWNTEELLTTADLGTGLSIQREDSTWRIDRERYKTSKLVSFGAYIQSTPGLELLTVREFDITGDECVKNWVFDADTQGWTAFQQVSGFGYANDSNTKGIGGTIVGSDPQIQSLPNLKVALSNKKWIHIRMKTTNNGDQARVYFTTVANPTFSTTRSKSFPIDDQSGYTWYHVDMTAVPGWDTNATLQQLEIHPVDDGTNSGSFRIDRIYIDNSST